jgi:cobalt-zinc-cadmium efflux system membrane fusion protein
MSKNSTKDVKPNNSANEGPPQDDERGLFESGGERSARRSSVSRRNAVLVGIVAVVALMAILVVAFWLRRAKPTQSPQQAEEKHEETTDEVSLTPEALKTTGIELEGVTQRPAVTLLRVTGTVEPNAQQTQSVTPLVSGRVERVNVVLGDRVRAGQILATIASPQIAQMHGKLHEAETKLQLAERNLQRVQKSENRSAVLQAKARLDEADATLRRTRRLIELGVGAGKDLIAAETVYKTAKAEYDFQSNISLNRELQEARAAVETDRVDVAHIRDELRALGAPVAQGEIHDHRRDTSLVTVRAPMSGTLTERLANAGAGIEAGKPLFTVANLSTVWVIANVPEAHVGSVRVGTPAEIRSAAGGPNAVSGRVSYINPQLNEDTRTAQVRIELNNSGERLKSGMFVEVGFQTGTGTGQGQELMVPAAAVQRVGDRTVVFIPKDVEPGHFEVRDVELGGVADGYQRVLSGLQLGDRVVTKGSFTLKTQLMKSSMGDEH